MTRPYVPVKSSKSREYQENGHPAPSRSTTQQRRGGGGGENKQDGGRQLLLCAWDRPKKRDNESRENQTPQNYTQVFSGPRPPPTRRGRPAPTQPPSLFPTHTRHKKRRQNTRIEPSSGHGGRATKFPPPPGAQCNPALLSVRTGRRETAAPRGLSISPLPAAATTNQTTNPTPADSCSSPSPTLSLFSSFHSCYCPCYCIAPAITLPISLPSLSNSAAGKLVFSSADGRTSSVR